MSNRKEKTKLIVKSVIVCIYYMYYGCYFPVHVCTSNLMLDEQCKYLTDAFCNFLTVAMIPMCSMAQSVNNFLK